MNEPHDPNRTVDVPASEPADSLDAGLAAGFGKPAQKPRSSLDASQRPVLLKEAQGESDHVVKPHSDAMPEKEQTGDRYQLYGEIARGGMGAVLRGRDVDLGRDLAVKVLLEKHANRPEVARRFLEEAQIGGQLQHPNVVPVYDIGKFGERPFFTMKLVKGLTLAAILAGREDVSAERPRLLGIALKVSEALAYAHAHAVIHRDLKPANVMVGAFGEVQVMDWGLAKVLAEGGVADEERASRQHQPEEGTLIRTARSSGSAGTHGTDTEAGSLLGTPAYMPPEQANGDVANLDRRCDVFGLGAILCEILTGKPPYLGRSGEEVRRKAANGDLADATARLDACGADAELIALAKKCLSPEAMDRPKDAQEVADGLTAYLDGVQERLRKAELAEAEARARAIEEAKRRRLTLALAATVLLAVTLGGGGWLWVKADRDARTARTTRDVNEALGQATALRAQAQAAPAAGALLFAQAREQAQRALALVESGSVDAALLAQVRTLQAELDEEEQDRKLVAALDEARLKQADTRSENRFTFERAVPLFREAFRAYGLPPGEGEPGAAAERIRKRPAAVRESIVDALDEWDNLAGSPKLGITEPHREWLRAVLSAVEPDDAWSRQVRAARAEKDATRRRAALAKLAESADVEKLPAQALTRLALQLDPVPKVKLLRRTQAQYPSDFWVNHNLGFLLRIATPPEWDEAVRFLTVAAAFRPDSPGCLLNLGVGLDRKGQVDDAIVCYRKAIALDPKYAVAHNNLGTALDSKGQVDEAIASLRKAIELDPKDAVAHHNLGVTLKAKGQVDEAIDCYHKAIALAPKYGNPHTSLGNVLLDKGQVDEAILRYKKAIELDPKDAKAQNNLGVGLYRKGQVDDAIACFWKAIELDPKYAEAHSNLGRGRRDKGQVADALDCFRQAVALDPKSVIGHNGMGDALAKKGQLDQAIACFRQAIALDPKDAFAHCELGNALDDKGKVDEAIASYRKAIAVDSRYVAAHANLGILLKRAKRDYDGAITCWRKVIELTPKDAKAHYNLGMALANKGEVSKAIASYKKAIELDPKFAVAHNELGLALANKGQVDEAIACFRKAIALDPNHAKAHTNLGVALMDKGKLDEAILCYKKTLALAPKDAIAHNNLGAALFRQDKVDEAIACYRKALALDPKIVDAHYNLGGALYDKGQVDEAIACFKNALALSPKYADARSGLAMAEQLAAARDKLAALQNSSYGFLLNLGAVPKGHVPGNNEERLALVEWCQIKKLHHTVAGLYAAAFAADPKLGDDRQTGHRYNAASHAAQAAAGRGADAAKLDDAAKAKLRGKALDWLKADLVAWSKLLESDRAKARPIIVQTLSSWQKDSALVGLREGAPLAKLPAEERKAFAQLWSDLAALLKKAETPDSGR